MDIEYSAAFAAVDSPVLRLCRAVDGLCLFIKPWLLDSNEVNLAALVKRYRGEAVTCCSIPIEYT
jgi:hypothetical protein